MLGRKTYSREEYDHARAAISEQLAAYGKLTRAGAGDDDVQAALDGFEAPFFNTMALALDRPFVHRVRLVAGKDGNALNEVELVCDSLMHNDGIFRGSNVLEHVPEQSVLQLRAGDPIRLTADQFERLRRGLSVGIARGVGLTPTRGAAAVPAPA